MNEEAYRDGSGTDLWIRSDWIWYPELRMRSTNVWDMTKVIWGCIVFHTGFSGNTEYEKNAKVNYFYGILNSDQREHVRSWDFIWNFMAYCASGSMWYHGNSAAPDVHRAVVVCAAPTHKWLDQGQWLQKNCRFISWRSTKQWGSWNRRSRDSNDLGKFSLSLLLAIIKVYCCIRYTRCFTSGAHPKWRAVSTLWHTVSWCMHLVGCMTTWTSFPDSGTRWGSYLS